MASTLLHLKVLVIVFLVFFLIIDEAIEDHPQLKDPESIASIAHSLFQPNSHLRSDNSIPPPAKSKPIVREPRKPVSSTKRLIKNTCVKDIALLDLVITAPTRSIMYIISHNNASDQIAMQYQQCYGSSWIHIARLPKSIYFESVMYEGFLPGAQSDWEKYDYVITATYKTLTRALLPRYMPLQTFQNIKDFLSIAKKQDFDILPFFRDFEDMIPTSVKYHTPTFLKVWHLLLSSMGYSQETIENFYYIKGFYRNAFMIKTTVLKSLVAFMQKAFQAVETHPEIQRLLKSDAHYVLGKREIAMAIFSTPYYQLHPFVFERLPVFFMYAHNHTICTGPDSPCKYNYKG